MRHATTLSLACAALLGASLCAARADEHATRSHPAARASTRSRPGDAEAATPLSEFQSQVVALTNRERLKAGLPALKAQTNLTRSAMWMAHDLATHRYFDHTDSGGRSMVDRITDFRYENYCAIGENIAMGQETPKEVVAGWMASPGHRANILSRDYAEIGVGYIAAPGHGRQGFWVQDFGAKFDRSQAVVNAGEPKVRAAHVTLSIHADEEAEAMRFSNDGETWTRWERFRPVRDWTLTPGPGPRVVHVEVRLPDQVLRMTAEVEVEEQPLVAEAAGARR
jgi:uncharacterized protein YkwD